MGNNADGSFSTAPYDMKIAIAQINTTIGDFKGNADKMLAEIAWASREGAQLVVFPELTTCGYPPRDLLEKPLFIKRNLECLETVAKATKDIAAVVGYAAPNESQTGRGLYNAAGLLYEGRVVFTQEKSLLPEYDVFDEARHFEPARAHRVGEYRGKTLALSLCEDIWSEYTFEGRRLYTSDPIQAFANLGAELIINIAASPYALGKNAVREMLAQNTARRFARPVLYCNLVGGNDELIFDGQSMVVNAKGDIVRRAKSFEEDHFVVDTDHLMPASTAPVTDEVDEVMRALTLGVRDYMYKCGFTKVVIGLSGGIDSAVVAAIAVAAIGKENVMGVLMPSPYTSEESMRDAHDVAKHLGFQTRTIPISTIYESYRATLGFANPDAAITVTEENLQARARGNILMALSNAEGTLVLSTGNKSELSVGYCTLYGDMAGGLAVISDVPKTMVYKIAARYRNEGLMPSCGIEKPPSADLTPGHKDPDNLPPYEILDRLLKLYVEEHMSSHAIIELGFDEATVKRVVRLVDQNEYKRRQAPPGLRVTSKAFGSGRRFPIARRIFW